MVVEGSSVVVETDVVSVVMVVEVGSEVVVSVCNDSGVVTVVVGGVVSGSVVGSGVVGTSVVEVDNKVVKNVVMGSVVGVAVGGGRGSAD